MAVLLMCMVITIAGCLVLTLTQMPFWLRTLSIAVLLLRVIAGWGNYTFGWFIAPDAQTYHDQAVALTQGYEPQFYAAGKEAWPQILAFLYSRAGADALIPVVLNAVLCVLMLPLLYWLAEKAKAGSGKVAVGLTIAMPAWWLWGLSGLREPLVWLLSVIALYGIVTASSREGKRVGFGLATFGVVIVLFAWVRGPLALVVGLAGAGALLVSQRPNLKRLFAVALSVPVIIALVQPQLERIPALQDGSTDMIRGELSQANSGFDVSSPWVLAARVVTGPWPWEVPGLGLTVIPDMVYLWAVAVLACLGMRALRLEAVVFLLPAAAILASLVVTSGNYGTMLRLRTQAILWVLPMLAVGYTSMRQRRESRMTNRRQAKRAHVVAERSRPAS